MLTYVYDGSLEGFFTCIFEAYQAKENPEVFFVQGEEPVLFSDFKEIKTDVTKAVRVMDGIREKISPWFFKELCWVFFSNFTERELILWRGIVKGFKLGPRYNQFLQDEIRLKIQKWAGKVSREVHRFKGLIRFRKLKTEVFYAPFSPDHRILLLLMPFFSQRFANQSIVLHDVARKEACYAYGGEWDYLDLKDEYWQGQLKDQLARENLHSEELIYQDLWQTFFDSIAISERKNPKLQRQFMPKKYWKYLIEK